jgi:hypothetical protein
MRAGGSRAARLAWAAVVIVIGVIAWRGLRHRSEPAHAPADALAALDARQAYTTGVALMRHGNSQAGLPYLRHALALRPELWQVHTDYAAAELNTVADAREHRGLAGSVTRSSWERSEFIREALSELEEGARLAKTQPDRAYVIGLRAQFFATWGARWDGLALYAAALRMSPGSPALAANHHLLLVLMRDPVPGARGVPGA